MSTIARNKLLQGVEKGYRVHDNGTKQKIAIIKLVHYYLNKIIELESYLEKIMLVR